MQAATEPPAATLSGIRVLDLTNVLAGPYCSYQLMLLGAEVVKVELPGHGDLARHLGPDPALNEAALGASFLAQNAGKKSVELDLKDPAGRAAFDRPGRAGRRAAGELPGRGARRLGFGWPVLRDAPPAAGLLRDLRVRPDRADAARARLRPGDPGLSGMMSITGTPRDRAAAGRLPDLRHRGRPDGGAGHRGRAGRAREHRRRAASSTCPCSRPPSPRWAGPCPATWSAGVSAGADGRPERHRRAVRHLRRGRRAAEHRGQPAGAVRDPVPAGRHARPGRRPAVRRPSRRASGTAARSTRS